MRTRLHIDTLTQKEPFNYAMLTGVYRDVPYELLSQNERIYFNGKIGQRYPRDVQIHETKYAETLSGLIGVSFFHRLGSKVLFDFQNMRIEGKGKPVKRKEVVSIENNMR